ncbi:MAG TPA: hypothetical protein VG406_16615 [Isosphaeraceae bacterium]|jgi:hypothetical protein|nr:hypothetical protein [Isosphaeraceae bacterium]
MSKQRWIGGALALAVAAAPAAPARGQTSKSVVEHTQLTGTDKAIVDKAVEFLEAHGPGAGPGEAAIAALALSKAGRKPGDQGIDACVAKIKGCFDGSQYTPQLNDGPANYEASCALMALAAINPIANRPEIESIANYLIAHQKGSGAWDYANRSVGDTSMTQYAILALWEAENAGIDISPEVWDKAAGWALRAQEEDGSWRYHYDEKAGGINVKQPNVSMTAGAVSVLLICEDELQRFLSGGDSPSSLLVNAIPENSLGQGFKSTVSRNAMKAAVDRGLAWIGGHFKPSDGAAMGDSNFYGLYGVERIGALINRDKIGGQNWYEVGKQFVRNSQEKDGHFVAGHGDTPNTSWAVLFMTRSTRIAIFKHRNLKLGKGLLIGGRELPKDLTAMTVAGGRVVVRPMNGAVEKMLGVLEDPNAEDATEALAGLVSRYDKEGSKALRPHKDHFRRLLANPDQGVRRVAAWALARTADLDVVPDLINALDDSAMPTEELKDKAVMFEAKNGLQLLSRKVDNTLGPPPDATPDQRREAIRKWRAWYQSVRPVDQAGLDEADEPVATSSK